MGSYITSCPINTLGTAITDTPDTATFPESRIWLVIDTIFLSL